MKKIAVFGGSFNPIHSGHLHLIHSFDQLIGFDKVILVPSARPPHKEGEELAFGEDRYTLCSLVAEEDVRYTVSRFELSRPQTSYTIDTVKHIKSLFPEDRLYLIIGSDMLYSFDRWYCYRELLTLCTVCAAARHQGEYEQLLLLKNRYEAEGGSVVIGEADPIELSSTEVRRALEKGESLKGKLPEKVERAIRERAMYQSLRPLPPKEEVKALLKRLLSEKRYLHSLAVAEMASRLAERYNVSKEKAEFAGLVHDIVKDCSENEQLQMIEKSGIIHSCVEQGIKKVWHSLAGEVYLRNILKVDDREILLAVRYHTTGRADMSTFEKVIFMADYISADRKYEGVSRLREKAFENLNEALREALAYTLDKLSLSGGKICDDTVFAYQSLQVIEKQI